MFEKNQHFLTDAADKQPDTSEITRAKPKFPEYADDAKRMASFKTWPENLSLQPDSLVEAGFVYTGVDDSVRCYYCGGGLRNWEPKDQPWQEHAKLYPNCPYVLLVKGQRYVDALTRGEKPDEDQEKLNRQNPKFPRYNKVSRRMESFKTWHENLPLQPDSLVDAGFVYTGVDDSVICYYCGGGLRNWKPEHQPWEEHAKLYPNCPYVLLVKGQCYVDALTRGEKPDEDQEMLNRQKPKFRVYADVSKRMESFNTWPENLSLHPDSLVDAGFVYTGKADNVRCYQCGVVLGKWQSGDKPWMEHAKCNPNCLHVLLNKGHIYADAHTHGETPDEDREELSFQKPKFPQYATVSKRKETFKTWPDYLPLKSDCLVEAGFVYTGKGDNVRCYQCGVVLGNWESGDKPWMEHAKCNPNCPHVLLNKGHIYADALTRGETPHEGRELLSFQKPKFPQYATVSKRMESFKTWPDYLPLQPDCLVEAGFVYTGIWDSVRCYHCGGGIRNWKSGDKPWTEHVKLYPNCPYVLLMKHQRFVAALPCDKKPDDDREMVSGDAITTSVAQSCLQNRFSKELVRMAIELFIQTYGHSNFEGADLCLILQNIENACDMTQSLYGVPGARTSVPNDVDNILPDNCMLCLDGVADVVCLPCGHLVCCHQCVLRLSNCPICNKVA